jgi:hypothetical protein
LVLSAAKPNVLYSSLGFIAFNPTYRAIYEMSGFPNYVPVNLLGFVPQPNLHITSLRRLVLSAAKPNVLHLLLGFIAFSPTYCAGEKYGFIA